MSGAETTVTVLVPSYFRPEPLRRCLESLVAQSQAADQVVVLLNRADEGSLRIAEEFRRRLPLDVVRVDERRQTSVMAAGVAQARGSVVASIDDDARARPDWLARLLPHYADERVGGVGGRDARRDARPIAGTTVGRITWLGRHLGNQHLGSGRAREVQVLRGANFSLRRELWRLDHGLRGVGQQVHWELDLCLRAIADGWRIVYDPACVVDHDLAPRVAENQRDELRPDAIRDQTHNELYALLKWSGWGRRVGSAAYGFAVGSRLAPGVVASLEQLARGSNRWEILARASAAARGRRLALRSFVRHRSAVRR
jgi:glycosyltransferase involved in cell wall biosynthesis